MITWPQLQRANANDWNSSMKFDILKFRYLTHYSRKKSRKKTWELVSPNRVVCAIEEIFTEWMNVCRTNEKKKRRRKRDHISFGFTVGDFCHISSPQLHYSTISIPICYITWLRVLSNFIARNKCVDFAFAFSCIFHLKLNNQFYFYFSSFLGPYRLRNNYIYVNTQIKTVITSKNLWNLHKFKPFFPE